MRIAYIGMSADPPHYGHVRLLRRVEELGFYPLVVLNSDSFIREYKGREPFMSQVERKSYFDELGYSTVVIDKDEQQETILEFEPSVIVVGTDWLKPEILPQLGIDEDFLTEHDIGLLILPRTKGISSTELRK